MRAIYLRVTLFTLNGRFVLLSVFLFLDVGIRSVDMTFYDFDTFHVTACLAFLSA